MKKAFLVTFSVTTRVIAESKDEAEELASAKIIADAEEKISQERAEDISEDIGWPFNQEDMAYILFPHLTKLDPEQEILVSQAWEMHLQEVWQKDNPILKEKKVSSLVTADTIEAQENMSKAGSMWDTNMEVKNLLQPETNIIYTISHNSEGASVAPEILDMDYIRANPGKIFATGTKQLGDDKIRWIGKVSNGDASWAIYYGHESKDMNYLKRLGTKLKAADRIKEFVPCTQEALEHYRF